MDSLFRKLILPLEVDLLPVCGPVHLGTERLCLSGIDAVWPSPTQTS